VSVTGSTFWRNLMRFLSLTGLVVCLFSIVAGVAGCGGPASPSGSSVATIRVVGETFRVKLVTDAQIRAARAAMAGGPAHIPNGRIVAGSDVNTGWSWHLEDVEFAEATIEVCDGRPSDVEKAGVSYGGGRFCPWSATVVSVEP
jgi:hypothetical protein